MLPAIHLDPEGCTAKVVESVIARCLAALAEEHNLLPANHFGGCPQRTTTDTVLHLMQRIKDSNCCTELKFNDFTSDPLLADCGLLQGSPLSPTLYLFDSADLLELIDPKDYSRLSLGYIDDTAIAVTSPDIVTNVRILSEIVPLFPTFP
ncbi:hypothetical protein GSI_09325 [Ganoderma sinense ZZ0214-1]|uniref:Reverse transcriptase domain-containing protein n=1 Tax=Ganoderma sinense ZZ0214-1 TaxID=1077348 RepID=A0A2G8S699_9APHY|nr:hypothetical protein GSI_09325 [Ganoderma sinense ZZ0214-1]